MYLEEIEQSEEGPLLTDALLTEKGRVDNASASFDGNVPAELSERCVAGREIADSGHCNNCEGFPDCNGDSDGSDRYSGTDSIVECVTIRDKTLRFRETLDGSHARTFRASEPCLESEPETLNGEKDDAAESPDESDCDTELGYVQNESTVADDDDEWGYLSDDSQERSSDEDLCEGIHCLHPRALGIVDLSKSEGFLPATDRLNQNETRQNYSDKIYLVEDDGSSSDSKSFKTCPEYSENSLTSSESESEREALEDWSDEPTQWESFEDDEEHCNVSESVPVQNETSNFALEDYFDLFDRADCGVPNLTQSLGYISCFDGGDVYDCLYGDQLHSSEKDISSLGSESEAQSEDREVQRELDHVCEDSDVKTRHVAESDVPNVSDATLRDANKDLKENIWAFSEDSYWSLMEHERETLDLVQEYYKSLRPNARGESLDSKEDCGSIEISREVRADIIHSVVSEYDKTEEGDAEQKQSRRNDDSEDEDYDEDPNELCDCEYCIPPDAQVRTKALLPQLESDDTGKICMVIDLDETLVHSSFTPVNHADFITPVDIDGTIHQVYVSKRPHVDEFLRRMGEMFECVLFTASLSKYADPVSDALDKWGAFRSRLFREACVFHKGNYVKDLSHLGRDLNKVIIIDNSPASYTFQPDNAVPVVSWFDDMSDSELLDLIPFFERLSNVDDIYDVLKEQRSLG
ncbi:uncharacterized protein [Syngnathus scovelli]|uniref:uncharacterized protein isoform X2 n=1 Tax=Syngnathus scovelli TaxID=161590 RepID=UPI002110D28C|nr:uncharacterized protein LOC125974031 isoform X2 [Syngnathus scovelli]